MLTVKCILGFLLFYRVVSIGIFALPCIKMDTGTERRIVTFYFKNVFVSEDQIPEFQKKNMYDNVYLKDDSVIPNFNKNESLKCAFFDILLKNCTAYKESGRKIKIPKSCNRTKEEMVSINDTMREFIEEHVKITNNNNDKISKHEMFGKYQMLYPKKKLWQMLNYYQISKIMG